MTGRIVIWGYVGIILYTISPMVSVLIAGAIARALGAQLDEGSQHPAYLLGVDIGGLLYTMFVLGWFMLLTIPTGLLALVVFTIAWPIAMLARKAVGKEEDDAVAPQ